jgi:hypothetical protein
MVDQGWSANSKKKFQIGITVMVNNAHPHQTVVGSEKKFGLSAVCFTVKPSTNSQHLQY